MRIAFQPIFCYSPKVYSQKQLLLCSREQSKPSFGTNSRSICLTDCVDYFYATDTKMFREDLDWVKFAGFLDKHFEDKEKINVICQACSDGSEAYTLAIALMETLGEEKAKKFMPIKAGDINNENIKNAQTGLINLCDEDIKKIKKSGIDFDKYFSNTDQKLRFRDDRYENETKTYEVNPILKNCVVFKKVYLESDISSLEDESNTVFLCRNVIPYLGSYDSKKAIENLGKNLKTNSIISLGDYYNQNFGIGSDDNMFIKNCGFDEIESMRHTYIKTRDVDTEALYFNRSNHGFLGWF